MDEKNEDDGHEDKKEEEENVNMFEGLTGSE